MSVTSPAGFRAAGVTAGLKPSGRPDLALVVNDGPLQVAAGVFTSNRVVAAPVVWSRQCVADGIATAVVLNSGGANACTGPDGFADTHRTAEHVATVLGISSGDVLVCSTGLIGERLPMGVLLAGVDAAAEALSVTGGPDASVAIMTTDSVAKTVLVEGDGWSVGGMAKGAGMLAPGLATMLVVLTTDAVVTAEQADSALRAATRTTFDRVDSDGCMSTNDTVLLLASGASGATATNAELTDAVTQAAALLARQLVADAEGASHDIAVTVTNAETEAAAVAVARAVTRSNLFKAAVFGNDPNWGRVLAAAPSPWRSPRSTRARSTSRSTVSWSAAPAASARTVRSSTSQPPGRCRCSSTCTRATRRPRCGPTTSRTTTSTRTARTPHDR